MQNILNSILESVKNALNYQNLSRAIGVIFVVALISLLAVLVKKGLTFIVKQRGTPYQIAQVSKVVRYLYFVVLGLYILTLFGINLKALWGATGIVGLTIGFAAQTSASNFISGLFVLGEKTIRVGDYIKVAGVEGTVDSVGLLSIKVHNTDNCLIRIPNSSIISSTLQNNSFYETRRLSFEVSVSYDTDMNRALKTLLTAPSLCPTVLQTPSPSAWYTSFGDSGINMTLAVYFHPCDLVKTRNDVFTAIKYVLDKEGVEIPYNRLDICVREEENCNKEGGKKERGEKKIG